MKIYVRKQHAIEKERNTQRNKDRRRCQLKTLISLIRLMTVLVDTPRGQVQMNKNMPCEQNNVTYIHPELDKTEVIHGSFVSVFARSFGVI